MSGSRRWARGALPLRLTLLLALPFAWLPNITSATTYRALSVPEVFLAADLAYTGRVAEVAFELKDGRPWTRVSVELDELLKTVDEDEASGDAQPGGSGGNQSGQLTIWLLGGEAADGSRLLVAGAPDFTIGEQVLVAAYRGEALASSLVGYRQGVWRLNDLGFVDDDGLYLELSDSLSLRRSALPSDAPAVLDAIRRLLSGEPAGEAGDAEGSPAPPEAGGDEAGPEAQAGAGDTGAQPAEGEPAGADPAGAAGGADPDGAEPGGAGAADAAGGAEAVPAVPETATISLTYQVNDSGGPLLLSDEVERAGAAWTSVASGRLELRPDEGAPNRFAYGPAELFGPDIFSLTLRWSGTAGSVAAAATPAQPGFEVLVSPTAGVMVGAALRHEFGVLLGLTDQPTGLMAMALSDPDLLPEASETAQLGDLSRFSREDINRDGAVDFYDLIELAAQYGRSGVNLSGDLSGDGRVDDADLARLRLVYQFTEPRERAP